MEQKFGKYTLKVTVTDKEGAPNDEVATEITSMWLMYVAVKTLASHAKITEEDILRKLAEQPAALLTEDEIVAEAKEMLAKLCESGALTVDENGYYS